MFFTVLLLINIIFLQASTFGIVSNCSSIKLNIWNTNNYGNRILFDINNEIM